MSGNPNINVGVSADLSGLKTGMNEAAKSVQDAGNKMQTAAKEATQKTEASFANLRQAYRATAKDAYEIALKQGTQSQAFREAITAAGEYKDELDQVNNSISVLSSDTPVLTGALGLGQGLAGAFSAATGAMAVFGAESEDVQKALLKVQGAMALTQGLQAVGQLGDAFSSFADVLDVKVLPALKSIGLLIAANPIAVVATAVVGLSVAYAALADNTDRAAKAERNYIAVNFNASATILEQTEKIKEQNKELLIQANAKQKGIEVDAERANLAAIENKQLEDKLETLKQNVKYQDASTESGLLNNINIKNQVLELQNQINANKDLISAYKEKIRLESIINAKDPKTKGGSNSLGKITFTPIVDPTAVDDLTGLFDEIGETVSMGMENAFSPINQGILNTTQLMTDFATQAKETLINGAAAAFTQFAAIAGANLAGADQSIADATANIMAGMLTTIGSAMIAAGASMAFGEPFFGGKSIGMLAGGAALVAAGAALGQASSGKKANASVGSGNGSGYTANNGFSGFTPNDNQFSINSRLVGTDLLLSVQKSSKKMERIR